MTEQEKFELWLKEKNMWFKDFSEYTNLGYPNAIKAAGFESWKAAKQGSAAEITEWAAKHGGIVEVYNRCRVEIAQLQAAHADQAERVRVLELVADEYNDLINHMDSGGNFYEFMETKVAKD